MKEKFDCFADQLVGGGVLLEEAIEILERSMIRISLEKNRGRQSATAKQLGIHRNTLHRKMVDYELDGGRARPRRKPAARAGRPVKRGRAGAA